MGSRERPPQHERQASGHSSSRPASGDNWRGCCPCERVPGCDVQNGKSFFYQGMSAVFPRVVVSKVRPILHVLLATQKFPPCSPPARTFTFLASTCSLLAAFSSFSAIKRTLASFSLPTAILLFPEGITEGIMAIFVVLRICFPATLKRAIQNFYI